MESKVTQGGLEIGSKQVLYIGLKTASLNIHKYAYNGTFYDPKGKTSAKMIMKRPLKARPRLSSVHQRLIGGFKTVPQGDGMPHFSPRFKLFQRLAVRHTPCAYPRISLPTTLVESHPQARYASAEEKVFSLNVCHNTTFI